MTADPVVSGASPPPPRRIRLGRIYLGLVLVGVGLVFLARGAGWLPEAALRGSGFWAVLLIALGLAMIKARGWAGAAAGVPLAVALAAVSVVGLVQGAPPRSVERWTADLETGVVRAEAEVSVGAGRLRIAEGEPELAAARLTSWWAGLEGSSSREGEVQRIRVGASPRWPRVWGGGGHDLRVALSSRVPLSLRVESGAADVRLDAAELRLTSLEMDIGASSAEVRLGAREPECEVRITGGASRLRLVLPARAGVRLEARGELSSRELPPLRRLGGSVYESEDYAGASKRLRIRLDLDASRVVVEREAAVTN